MLIGSKKIDAVVLAKATSTSGKYEIFFAEHYIASGPCYDVGSYNLATAEVVRRHYLAKEEALRFWERFKEDMLSKVEGEEKDEVEKLIIN